MSKKETYRIFVYGTLMRGERAQAYLANAKFVGEYRLKDYALYNLGRYPGIRPMAGGTVYGEVYEITADMLPEMDRYEGEGSLYHRGRSSFKTTAVRSARRHTSMRMRSETDALKTETGKRERNKREMQVQWLARSLRSADGRESFVPHGSKHPG